jgi:hypothetical protein
MNEYVLSAAIIITILAIGFFFLIQFGVSVVAYFGIAIIVIAIASSVIYTWWKTQTDKTVERLRTELLLKIKRDITDTHKYILEAEELVDQEPVLMDLEAIQKSMIGQKLFDENLNITEEVKKFTLTLIEQENRRTEQRLRGLENMAAVNYKPKLDEYIQEFNSKLEALELAGYNIKGEKEAFLALAAQETTSLRDMLEKKKRVTEAFSGVLRKCVTEVQDLLALSQKYGAVKKVENTVAKARKNMSNFDPAVELFIDSRTKLRNFLRDFFDIEYNQVSSSIRTLSPLLKDEHIDGERRKTLEELMEEALDMQDPGLLGELQSLKTKYKKEVSSIVEELYMELKRLAVEIQAKNPPEEIWRADDIGDSIIKRLSVDTDLRVFTRHAADALRHLTNKLNSDDAFLKILHNYDKVEPLITMKLNQMGELPASELNVKYPDKFLIIYSKRHLDTIYRQTTSTLVKI